MEAQDAALSCTWYTAEGSGRLAGKTIKAPDHITYRQMLQTNHMGCLTVIYDSQQFGKRLFPDIPLRQDYALWLELLRETDARCLPEVLATYRQDGKSLSSGKLKASYWNWYVLREIEQLPLPKAVWYFTSYMLRSLLKYR